MKKFIKKTIAGLIAGVMAVSSMPFTALADTASDKELIQSKSIAVHRHMQLQPQRQEMHFLTIQAI